MAARRGARSGHSGWEGGLTSGQDGRRPVGGVCSVRGGGLVCRAVWPPQETPVQMLLVRSGPRAVIGTESRWERPRVPGGPHGLTPQNPHLVIVCPPQPGLHCRWRATPGDNHGPCPAQWAQALLLPLEHPWSPVSGASPERPTAAVTVTATPPAAQDHRHRVLTSTPDTDARPSVNYRAMIVTSTVSALLRGRHTGVARGRQVSCLLAASRSSVDTRAGQQHPHLLNVRFTWRGSLRKETGDQKKRSAGVSLRGLEGARLAAAYGRARGLGSACEQRETAGLCVQGFLASGHVDTFPGVGGHPIGGFHACFRGGRGARSQ